MRQSLPPILPKHILRLERDMDGQALANKRDEVLNGVRLEGGEEKNDGSKAFLDTH